MQIQQPQQQRGSSSNQAMDPHQNPTGGPPVARRTMPPGQSGGMAYGSMQGQSSVPGLDAGTTGQVLQGGGGMMQRNTSTFEVGSTSAAQGADMMTQEGSPWPGMMQGGYTWQGCGTSSQGGGRQGEGVQGGGLMQGGSAWQPEGTSLQGGAMQGHGVQGGGTWQGGGMLLQSGRMMQGGPTSQPGGTFPTASGVPPPQSQTASTSAQGSAPGGGPGYVSHAAAQRHEDRASYDLPLVRDPGSYQHVWVNYHHHHIFNWLAEAPMNSTRVEDLAPGRGGPPDNSTNVDLCRYEHTNCSSARTMVQVSDGSNGQVDGMHAQEVRRTIKVDSRTQASYSMLFVEEGRLIFSHQFVHCHDLFSPTTWPLCTDEDSLYFPDITVTSVTSTCSQYRLLTAPPDPKASSTPPYLASSQRIPLTFYHLHSHRHDMTITLSKHPTIGLLS